MTYDPADPHMARKIASIACLRELAGYREMARRRGLHDGEAAALAKRERELSR